jgi:hypothetical protein
MHKLARPPRPARTSRYSVVHGVRAAGRIPRPRGTAHGEGARPGMAGCLRWHGLGRGRRGGRRAGAARASRRDGALADFVSLSTCLNTNNSNFLNRTAPNFEYESWRAGFSCFSTQNMRCQSTWKLCPSTSWTTFLKVDFEVFRWNLENVAKVPKDI